MIAALLRLLGVVGRWADASESSRLSRHRLHVWDFEARPVMCSHCHEAFNRINYDDLCPITTDKRYLT